MRSFAMWEHIKLLWAGSRAFQVAMIAGGVALLLILAANSQNPAGLPADPAQARGTFGKVGDGVDTAVDVGGKVVQAGGKILGPLIPKRSPQPAQQTPLAQPGN
jgi:hypothetical protein